MLTFDSHLFNPTALRKAKIAYNFGLSECNRVKVSEYTSREATQTVSFSLAFPVRSAL